MSFRLFLVAAIGAADLVETLSGPGPFTVFAPTDAAFAAIDPNTLADSLKPENKSQLQDILLFHVSPGEYFAADVASETSQSTALGQSLGITVSGNRVFVEQAEIIQTDIQTSNGVIHVIDAVMLPWGIFRIGDRGRAYGGRPFFFPGGDRLDACRIRCSSPFAQ